MKEQLHVPCKKKKEEKLRVSLLQVARDIYYTIGGGVGSNPTREAKFSFHFNNLCQKPFVIYLYLSQCYVVFANFCLKIFILFN